METSFRPIFWFLLGFCLNRMLNTFETTKLQNYKNFLQLKENNSKHGHEQSSMSNGSHINDEVGPSSSLLASMKENHISSNSTYNLSQKKHWCVLDWNYMNKNMRRHFDHFPHALEAILPCYSKFIENKAITTTTKDESMGETLHERNCGFMIDRMLVTKNDNQIDMPPYIKQVFDKIGCEVKLYGFTSILRRQKPPIPEGDVSFQINYYRLQSRILNIKYIDRPEHAHFLRRQFVPDDLVHRIKGSDKPLQIGLINRKHGRRVHNLQTDILDALQKAFRSANITYSEFEYTSVQDQAKWFATKDVIIGPHGAAMTNSLWITQETIVLQMYPDGYFLPTLEPLIEQVRGIPLQWYNKSIDPILEHKKKVQVKRSMIPNYQLCIENNFTVPAKDIVDRIRLILPEAIRKEDQDITIFL